VNGAVDGADPGFVVGAIAAATVPRTHTDVHHVAIVVALCKTSGAEDTRVVGGARLAMISRFSGLEDVSARSAFCGGCVFCSIHGSLGITESP